MKINRNHRKHRIMMMKMFFESLMSSILQLKSNRLLKLLRWLLTLKGPSLTNTNKESSSYFHLLKNRVVLTQFKWEDRLVRALFSFI